MNFNLEKKNQLALFLFVSWLSQLLFDHHHHHGDKSFHYSNLSLTNHLTACQWQPYVDIFPPQHTGIISKCMKKKYKVIYAIIMLTYHKNPGILTCDWQFIKNHIEKQHFTLLTRIFEQASLVDIAKVCTSLLSLLLHWHKSKIGKDHNGLID